MTTTFTSRLFWFAVLTTIIAVTVAVSTPAAIASPSFDNTPQTLPFSQDWSNTGLITTSDNWSGVPGIIGYLGDDGSTTTTGVDPQTILVFGTGTQDVIANQVNPSISNGGVAEFEIINPVVALQGSGTADYPFILLHINTVGQNDIRICYNVRDIDPSADNSIQQVGLQYRIGNSGDFTNLPGGYIPDATTGPGEASLVTPIDVTLPANVNNQSEVQIRILTTNAPSNDEWVGIDDIRIGSNGNCDGATPTPSPTAGGPTSTPTNTPEPTATATSTPTNACGDPATPIYTIQGSGTASPADGQVRTIEGVVVGDYQGATSQNGFNVQEITGDGNPATSDGIFVFAPSAPAVSVGDVVRVTGTVDEYFDLTEITSVTQTTLCGTATVPTPVAITLPVAAIADLERYEGMYVVFPQELSVTEVFGVGRYGEVGLSVNGRRFQPTNYVEPGAPANAEQSLNDRSRILLDDASNVQNPAVVPYLAPDNTLRPNDTTDVLTGTLSYGFNFYRVYPTETVTFTRDNPRDTVPADVGGTVKVASFNVLNYFTTIDNGSNGARGADSAIEFQRQRTKIVEAMVGLDADILGLIEIENNQTAIDDLVATLNISSTTPYTIAPSLPGTIGTDAIKVAIIYRPSAATPVGTAQVDNDPINDRPTVAQTFEVNGQVFTVVINHFKSKGCGGATGADTDQGDGQSCYNFTRTLQAQQLITFTNQIATNVGDDDFVLIGDFNSYAMEDPIDVLEGAGYLSLSKELLPEEERYSYIFFGQSGELDHGFVNDDFLTDVDGFTVWHINSDEPPDLDYNDDVLTSGEGPGDFNQPYLYQPNAFRSSDHDPLLIGLDLQPTSVTFFPDNIPVTEANTTVTVTVQLTQALDVPVVLDYTTQDGTATAGDDYVATSGTLTVTPGVTTTTFTVDILDDTEVEGNETVILEVTPDSVPFGAGGTVTGTITIAEGALTTVAFSAPNYSLTEANTTTTVTVTLNAALDVPAVLDYYTTDGTATAGSDYVTATGTITIPAGTTTGTFSVQILDDTTDEPDETVILNVTPGTLGFMGDVVTSTLTIVDNDLPPTAVTVASMDIAPSTLPLLPLLAVAGLVLWGVVVILRRR
jgi:predicted extracellular nuclease